ncbi:TNF receptor-associated factor 1 [Paramuricea clavata]|uniref:TNF receptor-associated factor 1, partial n=1 Tax=Paramuricea clavata TaxID=317549 RepID=A0A6S7GDM1_PARCT|nr:TNF receptor-associated factor 1 [Paramuricea clavata]
MACFRQGRGYNIRFVYPLDARLRCPIGIHLLRRSFQTDCGHRYCEDCIKQLKIGDQFKCPLDNRELSPQQIHEDVACNSEILKLQCFCTNKNLGCEWTGQLSVLEDHYQDCLGICPNEGCNVKMPKRNLGGHMIEECQFKKEPTSTMEVSGPQVARIDEEVTMSETTYDDGIFFWKIKNFGRQLEDAVAGRNLFINSPYFYVGRNGYKVCVRVYLNGDGMGEGTHLSLFFVVMRGDYDALLPWPFQQKVSFKLIDQSGNQQHIVESFQPDPQSPSFQRPTSKMNVASGCPLFVPKPILHGARGGYIKDETVFIKITVDTNGLPIY